MNRGRVVKRDEGGNAERMLGTIVDIHDRKIMEMERVNLEEQLRQSQKMEAVGALAGGIAHDFNNILFPIIGYAEMLGEEMSPDSLAAQNLGEILKAANRARDLVSQILTFGRKSEKEPRPVRIQTIAKETLKLLRSTIPTTVEITEDIRDTAPIMADPTQIHQVLMNLVTNAFHALDREGGRIEVILKKTETVPEDGVQNSVIHPNGFAELVIKDNGKGMDEELVERIFEPYFTTKEPGKGTGLGLSVVHGIVKEQNGVIKVESERGKGTRFHVFFPLIPMEEERIPTAEACILPTGVERILLVDDDQQIVKMLQYMLKSLGYQVSVRYSSIDALELFKLKPNDFDLVISDMTMPNMSGMELSRRIRHIRGNTPVIICTGYSDLIDSKKAREMGLSGFLMKPVIKQELAAAVRRALDGRRDEF